ncbi:unnamed protein product [Pedinophyceae sp. YPF-701]|nr:unnamed protein product [Pedinophyceae sp. YPF-701]
MGTGLSRASQADRFHVERVEAEAAVRCLTSVTYLRRARSEARAFLVFHGALCKDAPAGSADVSPCNGCHELGESAPSAGGTAEGAASAPVAQALASGAPGTADNNTFLDAERPRGCFRITARSRRQTDGGETRAACGAAEVNRAGSAPLKLASGTARKLAERVAAHRESLKVVNALSRLPDALVDHIARLVAGYEAVLPSDPAPERRVSEGGGRRGSIACERIRLDIPKYEALLASRAARCRDRGVHGADGAEVVPHAAVQRALDSPGVAIVDLCGARVSSSPHDGPLRLRRPGVALVNGTLEGVVGAPVSSSRSYSPLRTALSIEAPGCRLENISASLAPRRREGRRSADTSPTAVCLVQGAGTLLRRCRLVASSRVGYVMAVHGVNTTGVRVEGCDLVNLVQPHVLLWNVSRARVTLREAPEKPQTSCRRWGSHISMK